MMGTSLLILVFCSGTLEQERRVRNLRGRIDNLQWAFWSHSTGTPSISYRILEVDYKHPAEYLQGMIVSHLLLRELEINFCA